MPTSATEVWQLRINDGNPKLIDFQVWQNWLVSRSMVLDHGYLTDCIQELSEFDIIKEAKNHLPQEIKTKDGSWPVKEFMEYNNKVKNGINWLLSTIWNSIDENVQTALQSKSDFKWFKSKPHQLLLDIKNVFLRTYNVADSDESSVIVLRDFNNIYMYPNENLSAYVARFRAILSALKSLNIDIPDSTAAPKFIESLNASFNGLRDTLRSNRLVGTNPIKDLAGAIAMAYTTNSENSNMKSLRNDRQGHRVMANSFDKSNVECFKCGMKGHYAKWCRNKKKEESKKSESAKSVAAVSSVCAIKTKAVILDTGASVSVFNDEELLDSVIDVKPIIVSGAFSDGELSSAGSFCGIWPIYVNKNLGFNIISCSHLASLGYDVQLEGDSFRVLINNRILKFKLMQSGHYELEMNNTVKVISSELKKKEDVVKVAKNMCYPSKTYLKHMIQNKYLVNCNVTYEDVVKYYEDPPAVSRGKAMLSKNFKVDPREYVKDFDFEKDVSLEVDIMEIRKHLYLVGSCNPTSTVLCFPMYTKDRISVRIALEKMLRAMKDLDRNVRMITVDGELSIKSNISVFEDAGIFMNVLGTGSHACKVERLIRTIKERIRVILASLAYKMPSVWLDDLVQYVCYKLNSLPTKGNAENKPPRMMIFGQEINYLTHSKGAFGDIVTTKERNDKSYNSVEPRGRRGIIISHPQNSNGGVKVFMIDNGEILLRDNMIVTPADDTVLSKIEELANTGCVKCDEVDLNDIGPDDEDDCEPETILNMSVKEATNKFGVVAERALEAEVQQMLDLDVIEPIQHVKGMKTIPSSVFLKEKYDPTGKFEKMKARMVAGGHRQDKDDYSYEETSSPTCSLSSIYTAITVAVNKGMKISTIDVPGAYLNAEMKKDIYMWLNTDVCNTLLKLRPNWEQYMSHGRMCVKLKKALYGCVESAKLWYLRMFELLSDIGYECSAVDQCVFRKTVNDMMVVITVHVDDFLVMYDDPGMFDELKSHLEKSFGNLTIKGGDKILYLGMLFDIDRESKSVYISMPKLLDSITQDHTVKSMPKQPLKAEHVRSTCKNKATDEQAEYFRSMTAKLLYLVKRTRPDLLFAVCMLTTRTKDVSEEDYLMLLEVLDYVISTKEKCLRLDADGDMVFKVWVDASHASHTDQRGHTGIVLTLGKSVVYTSSKKQKLNTLSSTESELVALSEAYCAVRWIFELGKFLGIIVDTVIFHEDNLPVIHMLERGFSNSSNSRHIDIRYFFVIDKIRNGEIKVIHVKTEDQLADILTKAICGEGFATQSDRLLCSTTGGVGVIFHQDLSNDIAVM
jgi:hypothetical protein